MFIGNKAFTGAEGQLLRNKDGLLWGDVDGDRIADFQLGSTDFAPLYASDLVL